MTKNVGGVFVGAPQEQRGGDAAKHPEGNFVAAPFWIEDYTDGSAVADRERARLPPARGKCSLQ